MRTGALMGLVNPRGIARVGALVATFVLGPGLLSASCTGDPNATPPSTRIERDASMDAHVPALPATQCPQPANAASLCDGDDTRFTFFPAFACATDGGADATDAGADASDDADAATDAAREAGPCDSVNPFDVVFTRAACHAFVGAEARGAIVAPTDTRAPTLDEPADGDVLTPDNWAIFAWTKGTTARRGPLDRALDWIEPSAHAALRGDAYVLEFTVGCVEILRVMLAEASWAPDPAAWAILTSQTEPVTARVVWMRFADDVLASGVVPVASKPITFTMKR